MNDSIGFLAAVEAATALYDDDIADLGYVMNVSRLWSYDPEALTKLFAAANHVSGTGDLSLRSRMLIVLASSAARESSYCAFAWGTKFADVVSPATAASVVAGGFGDLEPAERALVAWTRRVVTGPHRTTGEDTAALREAGWTDRQIFAVTTFAALRMAFATVNDALGIPPDAELAGKAPRELIESVTFGRPLAT